MSKREWKLFVEDLDCYLLVSFASEAKINLHATILPGPNDDHKLKPYLKP